MAVLQLRDLIRDQTQYSDVTLEPLSSRWKSTRVVAMISHHLQCYAPQDRVFGLLGLLEEIDPDGFKVREYKSTSDLYTQFSRYLLSSSRWSQRWWWSHINDAFTLERMDGLPSWVPDLHAQQSSCTMKNITYLCEGEPLEFRSSAQPIIFELGTRPDEIKMKGKLLHKICALYPESPVFPVFHNAQGKPEEVDANVVAGIELHEWVETLSETVLGAGSVITLETFWRTLIGDSVSDVDISPQHCEEDWHEFRAVIRQTADVQRRWRLRNRWPPQPLLRASSIDIDSVLSPPASLISSQHQKKTSIQKKNGDFFARTSMTSGQSHRGSDLLSPSSRLLEEDNCSRR